MPRKLERLICRLFGHEPFRGRNGWENFLTGWFCSRCSALVTKDGIEVHPEAIHAPHR